jgi:hypothetical protein
MRVRRVLALRRCFRGDIRVRRGSKAPRPPACFTRLDGAPGVVGATRPRSSRPTPLTAKRITARRCPPGALSKIPAALRAHQDGTLPIRMSQDQLILSRRSRRQLLSIAHHARRGAEAVASPLTGGSYDLCHVASGLATGFAVGTRHRSGITDAADGADEPHLEHCACSGRQRVWPRESACGQEG